MRIIDGNTALRQCIPNTLATVAGEPSLFEKLYQYIEAAEQWLADNITSDVVLDSVSKEQDISPIRRMAANIIVSHALMMAVPSLDLVLTPNGFGIVNTGNIAPASKDRVERLIASLETTRDNNIDSMLYALKGNSTWLATIQAAFFADTLFPDLSLCRLMGVKESRWKAYNTLQPKLIEIESKLADAFFSQELYDKYRYMQIRGQFAANPIEQSVIKKIKSLEIMLLSCQEVHQQSYYDIVNIIRQHEDVFPEWHSSKVAALFEPEVFKNKKESTGYWF